MKLKIIFLLVFILGVILHSQSQDLPDDWSFSSDGRMLMAGGENDEGFYGQKEFHSVELEFLQSDWWDQMLDNYETDTDILATCWINGERFDSVGVRFKGATSFLRNDTEKKSFNITLDYMIDGQDIEGYNTFNLNCGWEDNSSMKEVLYNNVSRQYYMGLKSNYVNLTINGTNWGPYQNVQQFDSDYVKEWYLSNNGTIWRAERTDFVPGQGGMGGPNFGAGRSSLNYNGPNVSDYNTDYTLKRTEQEDPWEGLMNACDVLNNEPLVSLEQELYEVLDIDKACWFLANEIIFADDDSYINKGGSDYYVYYEAESGRIVPMEYDGNSVLGGNRLNWDLFYRSDNADFPLMNRMLEVPGIRQRYLAHVRVILEEYFTPNYIDPKIDAWQALIEQAIEDDPKKFYTINEFHEAIASLKASILTRRASILNDSEINNIEPLSISHVGHEVEGNPWQSPENSNVVDVSAQIGGKTAIESVWLYYGEGLTGTFTKVQMYDDGLSNDGVALDGLYGAQIPPFEIGTHVRYYVEAIADDNAGTRSYEPKGAEHDVYIYQVGFEEALDSSVVINELMAKNDVAVQDESGEFDDWVELYNLSEDRIDLSGWTLTDDIDEVDKFTFPEGTMIEQNGYLVIWADEDEDQDGLHAIFKLSADGETLYLLNEMQELVDEVSFPEAITDLAYARDPNGTGGFVAKAHTIGDDNDLTSSLFVSHESFSLILYPNPVTDFLKIKSADEGEGMLQIYNVNGQVFYSSIVKTRSSHVVDLSKLRSGIYFLRWEINGNAFMDKFVKL